jgi:hypothetical protein
VDNFIASAQYMAREKLQEDNILPLAEKRCAIKCRIIVSISAAPLCAICYKQEKKNHQKFCSIFDVALDGGRDEFAHLLAIG